jgi:hypothetical protein
LSGRPAARAWPGISPVLVGISPAPGRHPAGPVLDIDPAKL